MATLADDTSRPAALACLAQQERVGIQARLCLGVELLQHCKLGRVQHAVQPPQHGEGEDDAALLALLVVAAKEVRDGPDER